MKFVLEGFGKHSRCARLRVPSKFAVFKVSLKDSRAGVLVSNWLDNNENRSRLITATPSLLKQGILRLTGIDAG